jgi:hypothetical protein
MITTRTCETKCPNCQSVIDSASGCVVPEENDLSVCFYCGAILSMNGDLSVRLAYPKELEELKENQPESWNELMKFKNGIIGILGGIQ